MKKLFSALVVTMIIVLSLVVVANAEPVTLYPDSNGLYSMDYALSDAGVTAAVDGDMYGMVVIENTDVNTFELTSDNIRYIDQGEAASGKLVFSSFGPKDLTGSDTLYSIYIGGEGLSAATYIGTLSTTPPVATDITFDKTAYGVYVDRTVTIGATVKPEGYGLTVDSWESSDDTKATVADGVVTGVAPGEVTITVTAGDITKTVTVTVSEFVGVPGDMDGSGTLDDYDAVHLLFHYLIDADTYPLSGDGDVDGSGTLDDYDAVHLLFHYLIDEEMYPLYPSK